MKNKHIHPVTDVLNRIDEEMIRACMSEDVTPRATVSHRGLYRKLAVAAACFALVLSVGVAALLPLMRANDPTLPETGLPTSEGSTSSVKDKEEEYPFVKLQVLSYTEGAEEETDDPSAPSFSIEAEKGFRQSRLILRFDCAEGETVTITSHSTEIIHEKRVAAIANQLQSIKEEDGNSQYAQKLMRRLDLLLQRGSGAVSTLSAVNDTTYVWSITGRQTDYDVVDFTIKNSTGEIVGAGSICIGIRHLPSLYQLRTDILGSQRFDTPVSEEEAGHYLESLRATAEDAYNAMDFSPLNDDEGFALAYSAVSALPNSGHTGSYGTGDCLFEWYTGNPIGQPDADSSARRFFLLPDGTYIEVAPEGYEAYDGMLEQIFGAWGANSDEEDFSNLAIPLTDGRMITFREETFTEPVYNEDLHYVDGGKVTSITRNKWVAVIIDPSSETI